MTVAIQLGILIMLGGVVCREDLRALRIPDWTSALLFLSGLLLPFDGDAQHLLMPLANAAIVLVVVYALREVMTKVKGQQALGLGDVKLMAASAVWIDLVDLPAFLLVACSLALAFATVTARPAGRNLASRRIPFGPFLYCSLIGIWSIEHLFPATFWTGQ